MLNIFRMINLPVGELLSYLYWKSSDCQVRDEKQKASHLTGFFLGVGANYRFSTLFPFSMKNSSNFDQPIL